MSRALLPLLLALFALLAPPPAGAAPGDAAGADLVASHGWVRQTPPNRTVAAAYLRLENAGARSRALVGAESDRARVELHTMLREDGMMRMRPLDRLELPAGGAVELAPGGAHLMLFDVDATRAGTLVELELLFADGGRLPVALPVRGNAPATEED